MSKPVTTGALVAPMPFAERLQLVQEAVEQRIRHTPTTNPAHLRARLWCNWIKRNLLDEPAGREVQS